MQELTEMLPVGMVANGGLVAQIMADLAQKQRNLPGWEAFHYEKISETAVELTGGLVSQTNGGKRWLEPHDCITILLADVIVEMQRQGLIAAKMELDNNQNQEKTAPLVSGKTGQEKLHVCFALPENRADRLRFLQTLHAGADVLGAQVLACRLDDKTN